MEYINRDFKAVVQEISHTYIGAQMTVKEMTSFEDVPFKIKAVFNCYFNKEEDADRTIGDLLGSVTKNDFNYQLCKQLRLKFKVGVYTYKNNKKLYKSKTVGIDDFMKIHSDGTEYFDEEIVFNKLALAAFSM